MDVRVESSECAICLEDVRIDFAASSKELRCGHLFHKSCIDTWLNQTNTCPYCRGRVIQDNQNRLVNIIERVFWEVIERCCLLRNHFFSEEVIYNRWLDPDNM